jgi:hypothetical protein
MACPANSIVYNNTLCACPPGQLLNRTANKCSLLVANYTISTDSGVNYSIGFPMTFFDFDSIKKFTQSQAIFLEATLVMLLSWLFFCFFLRFMKLGDGRNLWFKIRWWISRLDVCFSTRHWLVIFPCPLAILLKTCYMGYQIDIIFLTNQLVSLAILLMKLLIIL